MGEMTERSTGKSSARRRKYNRDIHHRLKDVRITEGDRRIAVMAGISGDANYTAFFSASTQLCYRCSSC